MTQIYAVAYENKNGYELQSKIFDRGGDAYNMLVKGQNQFLKQHGIQQKGHSVLAVDKKWLKLVDKKLAIKIVAI